MIKKAVAEKYIIRDQNGHWLANIMLDDEAGYICVHSDYGTYAYWWTSRGRDTTLKEFLVSTNDSYVMDKFGYGERNLYFYGCKTEKRIKEEILSMRRQGDLEKDEARECFDELENLDGHYANSREMFDDMAIECSTLLEKVYNNSPFDIPWVSGTHPQLVAFMEKVWPLFMAEVKRELNASGVQGGN